jgi:general secretion pathway protein F
MVTSAVTTKPLRIVGGQPANGAVSVDDEQFAQDLSLMLRSGLSLMESLKTLRERAPQGAARMLDALNQRLQQGESLSQAMQGTGAFRVPLLACVRSSELTGDLPDSLHRYSVNAARLRAMRSKAVSALVYPLLLVSVASLVVLFLLIYVVPRFAMVLESSSHDLPAASRMLIAVGKALHQVPTAAWVLLGGLVAWGLVQVVQAARTRRLEAMLTELASRLPGLRDLVRAFGQSQLTRSGAMLVRSGVPVLKALPMCRDLLVRADRQALDRALAAASAGAPLAGALHDFGLIDSLGLRVLRVAEQSGQLESALDRLADVYDHQLERTLERVSRLLEPLLMMFIGLVVGGIVVLMYLPIFQLAASI